MIRQEFTITTHNIQLAAIAWGDPKAPPMLALHGWLDNAATFERLAPLLESHYIVAVDLPGHGLSDHLPQGYHYHFIDSVEYVLAVANHFSWQTFAILGHSMGAGIATLMAGTMPEMVTKLILLDALGPYTIPDEQAPEQLQRYLTQFESVWNKTPKLYADFNQAVAARQKHGELTMAAAEILAHRGTMASDEGFCWRHDSRLLLVSPSYLTDSQIKAFIVNIQAPVCLIHASDFYQLYKHRCAWVQHLSLYGLDGGHHVHLIEPQLVTDIINAWLQN
jgi:pimeloyl-ACP methyl ester carboxylesterase